VGNGLLGDGDFNIFFTDDATLEDFVFFHDEGEEGRLAGTVLAHEG
jgi:hypothetical protein